MTQRGVTRSICVHDQLMNPSNFTSRLLTGHPWSRRFPSWLPLPRWQKRQGGAAPGNVPEASTAQTSGRRCSAPPGGTEIAADERNFSISRRGAAAAVMWIYLHVFHSWFPFLIILLTIKMMPNTASQRRTVEAGFHSNFTQLYGVNWNAIRFIFPLGVTQQRWC